MSENVKVLVGCLALALGVLIYLPNPGGEHASTDSEEHLNWQITRLTAESGEWFPRENAQEAERYNKSPALIWQGILMTDWGRHWELWRLRLPVALYTLATAVLVLLLARRLSGSTGKGLLAATLFLAFFSTYRYGRVVLPSAPETFWFFLPVFILLYRPPRGGDLGWSHAVAFGLMVGVGLLYRSFAFVVPFCAGLVWWTLHQRAYRWPEWIRRDAPKIAVFGLIAIGVFGLWFWLNPYPQKILQDFAPKENDGTSDPAQGNYFVNFVTGHYSIWRIFFSYPLNAGLLAPAIVALFIIALRGRRTLADTDKLLWIWVITPMIIFAFPERRDERNLLPAMPALAVLAALSWSRLPRWTLSITLVAASIIALNLMLGGIILTGKLAEGPLYPWYFAPAMATVAGTAFVSLFRADWTRAMTAPAVLLVYLAHSLFTLPFDGSRGKFPSQSIDAVQGRTVVLPAAHRADTESYRFVLPGANVEAVHLDPPVTIDKLRTKSPLFILTVPCSNTALAQYPGIRILGDRLRLINPLNAKKRWPLLSGGITDRIFCKDLLIEIDE